MCAVVWIKNAGKTKSLNRGPDINNEAIFICGRKKMDTTIVKKPVTIVLIVSLVLGLCGCCSEKQSHSDNGLRLCPIYGAAIGGAIIGGIIGHQSDETGEGAAIGAVVLGVGELLRQTDELAHKEKRNKNRDECEQQVVVEIHNSNGSVTPVKLRKDGSAYIGPKGERYEKLPTEEQLKPVYGL
jgi:hypothetical protein